MAHPWLSATASDLGRGIAAGKIDPVELCETYLEAAESHEFSQRIFTHVTRDRALSEAQAAKTRAEAGLRNCLLDGVPVSWKDLVDTAGIETVSGSDLLKGRVPAQDGECLQHATRAGLVCMGKTHMSELAFSGLGYNPITQTPPCVNNHAAVPGGSSSGAAASVAFNLSAAAIGSDTGGSVRIPAAWNDLVGLKTTSGLVSLKGVVPLVASFDTIGPLCRSVEDSAHLLAALTGTAKVADLTGASLSGRHFALCKTSVLDDLDEGIATGFQDAIDRLAKQGAKITEIDIPLLPELLSLSPVVFTVEAYAQWQTELEANPDAMFPQILERFRGGLNFSGIEYVAAQKRMMQLRQEYLAHVAGFDAVLLPASPILPPDLERLKTESAYYQHANLMALRNTRVANLLGLSSLTLPTGTPSVGLMAMGTPFGERKILRVGAALEAALNA